MRMPLTTKGKIVFLFVILLFLISMNYLVLGKSPSNSEPETVNSTPSFWLLAFKTLVLLGVIILLIYAVLYLLRRFVYRSTLVKSKKAIKILDTIPLVQKKTICIVKIVDRILVLGISEASVNTLTVINTPDEIQQWESELATKTVAGTGGFANQLNNLLKRQKN